MSPSQRINVQVVLWVLVMAAAVPQRNFPSVLIPLLAVVALGSVGFYIAMAGSGGPAPSAPPDRSQPLRREGGSKVTGTAEVRRPEPKAWWQRARTASGGPPSAPWPHRLWAWWPARWRRKRTLNANQLAFLTQEIVGQRVILIQERGKEVRCTAANGVITFQGASLGRLAGQTLRGHHARIRALAYSRRLRTVLSYGEDCTLRHWSIDTGKATEDPVYLPFAVRQIAFDRTERRFVLGFETGQLQLWDAHTFIPLGGLVSAHAQPVTALAAYPNEDAVLSGSPDGQLIKWSSARLVPLQTITECPGIHALAFVPSGSRVVCGYANGTVQMRDQHTLAPIENPLRAHRQRVSKFLFRGNLLFSSSLDRTVAHRRWDRPADPLATPPYVRFAPAAPTPRRRIVLALASVAVGAAGVYFLSRPPAPTSPARPEAKIARSAHPRPPPAAATSAALARRLPPERNLGVTIEFSEYTPAPKSQDGGRSASSRTALAAADDTIVIKLPPNEGGAAASSTDAPRPAADSDPTPLLELRPGAVFVERVAGGATVTIHGHTTPLQSRDAVPSGSTVATDSSALVVLTFGNGTTIELDQNAELVIDEFLQAPPAASAEAQNEGEGLSLSRTTLTLKSGQLNGTAMHLTAEQGSSLRLKCVEGWSRVQDGKCIFRAGHGTAPTGSL